MINDISFVKKGWIMWCGLDDGFVFLDDIYEWIENFIILGLTHEIMHDVLNRLEGLDVSDAFDNIFGLSEPTILLVPEEETMFDSTVRQRANKTTWKEIKV